MGQQATLRAIDAELFAAAVAAGLADTGTYTPPGGGAGVTVRVMRDDVQVETFGDVRPVASVRIELTLLKADVAAQRGGTVVVDGATFVLEALVADDQSLQRWVVLRT